MASVVVQEGRFSLVRRFGDRAWIQRWEWNGPGQVYHLTIWQEGEAEPPEPIVAIAEDCGNFMIEPLGLHAINPAAAELVWRAMRYLQECFTPVPGGVSIWSGAGCERPWRRAKRTDSESIEKAGAQS